MTVKGYVVDSGYYGWVDSESDYMLFATEGDYLEYIEDNSKEEESE